MFSKIVQNQHEPSLVRSTSMIDAWDTRAQQNMKCSAPVFTGMIDHRHRCAATHDHQIKISCRHCSGTPNVGESGTSTTGEGSAGRSPPPSTSAQHWAQPCLCDIVMSKAEGWCSPESDDEYSEGVSEQKQDVWPSSFVRSINFDTVPDSRNHSRRAKSHPQSQG